MLYKKLNIPFYSQKLHIIISDDVEKEIDNIRKKFYPNLQRYDFSGYSQAVEQHHLILINIKHVKKEIDVISTICHEAFHITNFIMKRVGIDSDVNNDEAQAYLLSYIVEEVLKVWCKYSSVDEVTYKFWSK